MKILVINAGSSSLKYQLMEESENKVLAKGVCERIGDAKKSFVTHKVDGKKTKLEKPMPSHNEAIEVVLDCLTNEEFGVIKDVKEIGAFGHRVVHGGEKFTKSTLLTPAVLKYLKANTKLAPLHAPANIMGIEACKKIAPKTPNVLVFDTAFHSTMPEEAYRYALPKKYYKDYQIRRYGFHGTSHKYVSREVAKCMGKKLEKLKIVTCHLGNGASIAAVKGGQSIDTSMGFTPLEGLVMGTRSGDLDPAIVEYLVSETGKTVAEITTVLNKQSGVSGIVKGVSDMRDIEDMAEQANDDAILALNMMAYRIKKYIGSYAAVMGGVDAIVFTAGVGENSPIIREKVLKDLGFLGVKLNNKANFGIERGKSDGTRISYRSSKVQVWVIPTDEELVIAKDTAEIVNG